MEISKRRKIRGLEEWKIGNDNGKRQGRDPRLRPSGTEGQTRHWIATQPAVARDDRHGGFTLVELVIVIAIVIVLSVVSVPIYRSYVDKAKYSEAYALFGTILSAQKAYYSEYGNFFDSQLTNYDTILGIDGRGNKYFTWFNVGSSYADLDAKKHVFCAWMVKPIELRNVASRYSLNMYYDITTGVTFIDNAW